LPQLDTLHVDEGKEKPFNIFDGPFKSSGRNLTPSVCGIKNTSKPQIPPFTVGNTSP
jgi:hypothetical protein